MLWRAGKNSTAPILKSCAHLWSQFKIAIKGSTSLLSGLPCFLLFLLALLLLWWELGPLGRLLRRGRRLRRETLQACAIKKRKNSDQGNLQSCAIKKRQNSDEGNLLILRFVETV